MGQDFEIDEGAIAQLMSEIQRAFDKHSIRVPIEGEPSMKLAGSTTTYNGPVILGNADGAQLAWGALLRSG